MLNPQGAQLSLSAHCPRKTAFMLISQPFKAEQKAKEREERGTLPKLGVPGERKLTERSAILAGGSPHLKMYYYGIIVVHYYSFAHRKGFLQTTWWGRGESPVCFCCFTKYILLLEFLWTICFQLSNKGNLRSVGFFAKNKMNEWMQEREEGAWGHDLELALKHMQFRVENYTLPFTYKHHRIIFLLPFDKELSLGQMLVTHLWNHSAKQRKGSTTYCKPDCVQPH